nr:hypothetical protein Itr_chr10CG15990 [Ipomoea trifida]
MAVGGEAETKERGNQQNHGRVHQKQRPKTDPSPNRRSGSSRRIVDGRLTTRRQGRPDGVLVLFAGYFKELNSTFLRAALLVKTKGRCCLHAATGEDPNPTETGFGPETSPEITL